MKKFKMYIPVLLSGLIILFTSSCKKTFYTDVNINLNAPDSTKIIPSVLLPTVEAALAYSQGGDMSRFTSLIMQQTLGAGRQAQGYYQYTFTSVDFDSFWGNMYTSVMQNNRTLMKLADAKGNNRYGGISRILMAYSLQLAVDAWGPIPYSDAFKGAANLQSKYDNDKALYDTASSLLTTAIAQLTNTNAGFAIPGTDDIIYGGDASKWIKFAHAIKARLYIHQSKGNAAMANNALAEIAQSFSSNTENAKYVFQDAETSANPWYQFNEQRQLDIAYDESTLGKNLRATHDPRFTIFADTSFHDVNGVGMGDYYGSISAPVEFITYDELQFMKAEATLTATGDVTAAQTSYRLGIQRNMEKLGVPADDIANYITANGKLPATASAAIAQVAAQEYIALYLNPEAWTLWRRTGSPALTPVVGTSIPRRFLYPQTEYSYNAANIPGTTTLFTPRIFWDK